MPGTYQNDERDLCVHPSEIHHQHEEPQLTNHHFRQNIILNLSTKIITIIMIVLTDIMEHKGNNQKIMMLCF